MIAITYLLTVIYTGLEAWRDYYLIAVKRQSPDHVIGFVRRAFMSLVIALLSGNPYYFFISQSVFYLLFDPFLNWLRHRPFFYLGNTSRIDRLFSGQGRFLFICEVWVAVVIHFLILAKMSSTIIIILSGLGLLILGWALTGEDSKWAIVHTDRARIIVLLAILAAIVVGLILLT